MSSIINTIFALFLIVVLGCLLFWIDRGPLKIAIRRCYRIVARKSSWKASESYGRYQWRRFSEWLKKDDDDLETLLEETEKS